VARNGLLNPYSSTLVIVYKIFFLHNPIVKNPIKVTEQGCIPMYSPKKNFTKKKNFSMCKWPLYSKVATISILYEQC